MGTPFPWLPMIAMSIGLVGHSYALTSLFPYVGYMMEHLGVARDKDQAGYYAGYVSSASMVGRFISSYFWGRVADRYGRLPVIYLGLTSMAVLSIGFGMSTTFWWALGCRFLLGLTNGLLGISKTMISEVCGKEHETVGMSALLGCSSIGLVIGPGLGGLLAEPATHYPTIFSEAGLFGRFPYLLPNVVGACLALPGLPMVFFFLKETNPLLERGGIDSRGGFELLPVSEAAGAEDSRTADEEVGRVLEMAAMAQASSLENGDGDEKEPRRKEARSGEGAKTASWAANTVAENIAVGGHGSGGAEDTEGESHRLLSNHGQVGDERVFTSEGGHRPAHSSSHRHDGGTKEQGEGKAFDDGGNHGEIRWPRRKRRASACWQEISVPAKLLKEKRIRTILFVYAIYSFIAIGSREVYPLWALSTVSSGGLNWTTQQIGEALSECGVGVLIFQLLVYPRLSERMGMTRTHRYACFLSMPVFLVFPFLSRLHDSEGALIAASLVLLFLYNVASNVIFINISLATNNAVDPSRRATLNGLSMTVGSLCKAAGPVVFSAIFAWSVDGRHRPFPLDYHLTFYLMALGMVFVSWASWGTIVSQEPTN